MGRNSDCATDGRAHFDGDRPSRLRPVFKDFRPPPPSFYNTFTASPVVHLQELEGETAESRSSHQKLVPPEPPTDGCYRSFGHDRKVCAYSLCNRLPFLTWPAERVSAVPYRIRRGPTLPFWANTRPPRRWSKQDPSPVDARSSLLPEKGCTFDSPQLLRALGRAFEGSREWTRESQTPYNNVPQCSSAYQRISTTPSPRDCHIDDGGAAGKAACRDWGSEKNEPPL